ncbi:MAG: type II secretion system protein [Akkermansiaceae bacterium]
MHFSKHQHSRETLNGFTLVELLVVIAIIAVLAALIFAVVNRALLKGQQVACVNLMRNVEIGMEAYLVEQNRPPLPDVKKNWDTIIGDPGGLYSTAPIVAVLAGSDDLTWEETDGNTFDMTKLNPRGVKYLELSIVTSKGDAGLRDDGKLYDPWGNELMIAINSLVQYEEFADGYQDERLHTWTLAEWDEIKPGDQDFVMWSYGADGVKGKGGNESFRGSDDVKSF